MSLTKATGNMYEWISHMWPILYGQCPHRCDYCYVKSGRVAHLYRGPVRLSDRAISQPLGTGRTIFVEHRNDLWAAEVPADLIKMVLAKCHYWPKNQYVFQTKNPARYLDFMDHLPVTALLGCTIETNRAIPRKLSQAPQPWDRYQALMQLHPDVRRTRLFITIEPIMDLDTVQMVNWMDLLQPAFINIGADSKGNHLPEPPPQIVRILIQEIQALGISIREKHNLERILQ